MKAARRARRASRSGTRPRRILPALLAAALLCLCALPPSGAAAADPQAGQGVEDWNRHIHQRLQSRERQEDIERARSREAAGSEEQSRRETEAPPAGEPAHSLDTAFLEGAGGEYTLRAEPDALTLGVERDVLLTIFRNGQPVEGGLEVVFATSDTYPGLHGKPRKTAPGGTVLLKKLLAISKGYAPLRLSIQGGPPLNCEMMVHPPATPGK